MALKIIAALLIMLTPLLMAACGKAETAAPVSMPALIHEPDYWLRPATASAEEISLDGIETTGTYLDTVLPCQGTEELIPYAADIYHAGDCALTFCLYGFCIRTGELVAKSFFSSISAVRGLAAEGSFTENLYLCKISSSGCAPCCSRLILICKCLQLGHTALICLKTSPSG